MLRRAFGILTVPTIASAWLATMPAAAQSRATASTSAPAGAIVADQLHERAAALSTRPDRYGEAAELLVRAARVRGGTDFAAVTELIVAAKLYSYANQTGTARSVMEEAASHALRFGDVVTAAHAYLDAAFLALRQKDMQAVQILTANAERLAESPQLSCAQRADVLYRIHPARLSGTQP